MCDQINHPPHYGGKDTPYETIKVIERWALDFNLGNVIKYISRAGLKNESTGLEDLKKAKWYLDREIQTFEQNARYREEIRQEVEAEYADRTGGVREQHNNDALSNANTGADLLPLSREGTDPQGNEPVPGREEAEGPVSGKEFAKGWRWDDAAQKRVGPDQDPTGETLTDAEKARRNKEIKAQMEAQLRELERAQRARYIQDRQYAEKSARDLFEKARELRDKELDGNAPE